MIEVSYVLPLRLERGEADGELRSYLGELARLCAEVVVVDGSPPAVFARTARGLPAGVVHVPPRGCSPMGKVASVATGVAAASHEAVVIADDDVRYTPAALRETVAELERAELVRPQNHFSELPWHARWDTARTLLNRAFGADYPGTLAVRRSFFLLIGGYSGDVMFENLELMRTVGAHGGRVSSPLGLYVPRVPPSASHFWSQRVRQAYDSFATPARLLAELALLPALLLAPRCWAAGIALGSVLAAEAGRRRAGGARVFPAASALLAPVWLLERAVCSWLAVAERLRFGGVRYRSAVIATAAHSSRALRARAQSSESGTFS